MKAFDIIKQKGEYFQGRNLYYLKGVDRYGDQVCEVDGSESYCSECHKKIALERNEELTRIGYAAFFKSHDCSNDQEFEKIGTAIESCPEYDDFMQCENCGAELEVSVLFTFSEEIDHWINEIENNNFSIGEISEQDAYRIYSCLTSEDAFEKHHKEVKKLRRLINSI